MLAYFLLCLTTLFWAGNFVLARAFSVDIPPVTLAFVRWFVALLILLPFSLPVLIRHGAVIRRYWKRLALMGGLSVAGFNTLAYIGLQSTTAMNGTLMQSSMPIMILLISAVVLGEKASFKQWGGVALSLLGVSLLITQGQLGLLLSLQFNPGDLWILCAMFVWATYSVALRWRPKELTGFAFFSVTLLAGNLILAPFAYFEMSSADPIEWNVELYGLVLYLAIFPAILAYLFWNYGVSQLGAETAGLFVHLVPLWGMILSILFLGEELKPFHLWGIALIFSGIYLAVISGALFKKNKSV